MEKKLLPGYGRILILALTLLLLASNNTFAQIALRGVSTANSNTGTLTINKPAGIVAGDLMIFNIAQRGTFTLSNPISAGWSPIAGADLAGPFLFRWGALLYKIATAAEPANYSFTLDAQNNGATGAIVAFSGVDQVTPFDVPPGALSVQGTQLGIAASAKTTVTNNAAVVMFAMAAGSSPTYSGWSTTSPGALAELYDNQNGGLSSVGAAWAIKAVAGGTGAGSATLNTAERNGGILLALRLVAPPTITGLVTGSGCVGSSLTITGTNLLGATAVSIGGTAAAITATTATSVTVTVGSGTTGTVQVTTPGGSATSAATFTVNPLPSPIGGGAATVCTGSDSPAFTNATAGGTWSVANGTGTATIDNSTGIVTGVTAGAVTVVYTSGSCSVSKALNVQQTPGAIGGGAAAVCVGASTPPFSNASIGGTWSVINGTGSATINNGTRTVTGVTAGTVTVVYTVGSCTPATYNLTVNPSPAAIGGGAATVCTGSDSPAFTNATAGGTWSVANGTGTATIDNSTGIVTGVTAGAVTVVYTVGSCSVSKALNVQQTPGAIGGGAAAVCVGASTPAFTNTSGGGTWSVINGTGSATINTVTRIVTGVTAGTVTVVYTLGTCAANYLLTVNATPVITAQPVATSICTTGSGTFSVTATGATAYQWRRAGVNLTNVAPYSGVNTSTLTITNPAAAIAGNFDVIVSNTNCSVTSATRALTVTAVPAVVTGPVPADNASGVCYAGSGPVANSVGWGAAPGALSYDVYFGAGSVPATVTANVAANNYNTGALLANTTYYWRVVAKNGCGDAATSATFSFTTAAKPCYCLPSVSTNGQAQTNYINQVNFLGTLLDTFNASSFSTAPLGYHDYTNNTPKSIQADGNGMNIFLSSAISGLYKVWVDWNQDGIFNNTANNAEIVYDSKGIAQAATTFGVVIPVGTPPGDYRMRLRVNGQTVGNIILGDSNASPCGNLNYAGETEDYLFTVVSNCSANIKTAARTPRCGPGSVKLEPTATSTVDEFRWYSSETGGAPIAVTPATGDTTSWDTPAISSTTTYYVTAFNGCESLFRTPMVAVINATPEISFTPSSAESCGDTSVIAVSATGSNQVEYLIDENFTNGLNGFSNQLISGSNGTNANAAWRIRTSIFTPALFTWFPAISSGMKGNNFVMSTSDLGVQGLVTENALVSPVKNTTTFVNLTLTFKMYYSRYYRDGTNPTLDFVNVEVATNAAGTNWVQIPGIQPNPSKITTDIGLGTKFSQLTYNLGNYINQANLRIRILYHGVWCDGVAVDDIQLFGEKPLTPSFSWTSNNPIQFYSDAAATLLYAAGTPASTVYIKPTAGQLESYPDWNVTATATLSNLCFASGNVIITNNNKVWNTLATDWNTPNWKPGTGAPLSNQCVVIKTPVNVLAPTIALAKTLKVEPGGSLTIRPDASVKIEDFFMNNATVDDLVVKSGGSLVQVADVPSVANTGSITAERSVNLTAGRQQYNFLISPVEDQNLKTVYPGIDYVLYYNETTGKFYASSGVYIKGRGLAVKEANATVSGTSVTGIFKGKPVNGAFSYGIVNSNTPDVNRGFNLTGNPYPSTIDLVTLYGLNNSVPENLSSTFYFWDSTANSLTVQQGDAYGGEAYALFNAVSGTGTAATGDPGLAGTKIPTRYVSAGQGFMVKTNVAAMNLNFNNSIRTTNSAATDYFGKEQTKDRYWLNMKSPANITAHLAVVYFAGGNNGFAMDDSRSMLGSDAVYSIVENEKVAINGRSSFIITDTVPLGGTHFTAGNYTISLGDKEGVFANGQAVYLKDRQAGIIANLSEGSYTFAAVAGESTGRFEIIYRPESIMATDGSVKEELQVYRDGHDFVVKAQRDTITVLEVYDTAGRLIYKIQPNSIKAVVDSNLMSNGVYVLKITQNGRITAKKILK